MSEQVSPIELDFKSALTGKRTTLRTFTSYSFDSNLLVPASPFRFTAPGVDKATRVAIRSGDMVELYGVSRAGARLKLATGFVDETDTHVSPSGVEYLITGRDTLGQLVDNAAVDASNRIIHLKNMTMQSIAELLVKNTRMPQQVIGSQVPVGNILFQTNPGETKINALQRYLEFTNCLAWSLPGGTLKIGKPNFTQDRFGKFYVLKTDPTANNVLECRVRRNVNSAIRFIATQMQNLAVTDPASVTILNQDKDVKRLAAQGVGRSVYRLYSQGGGAEAVNQITQVGNDSGAPSDIGQALSLREIARENMKVLDVELVLPGHLNGFDLNYRVDQIYNVNIEDDDVSEDLFTYAARYDLTPERGRTTTLRFCRKGTIVAYADAARRVGA